MMMTRRLYLYFLLMTPAAMGQPVKLLVPTDSRPGIE
jgi:hypothetical protein